MAYKIVVGCIVEKDGKIAMVQEGKEEIAGLWNLPVGGLEGNETIAEGAKRETQEETGLDIELTRLVGIYQNPDRNGKNVVKFIYAATVLSGDLKHIDETIQGVQWVGRDKISELELRDNSVKRALDDYFAGKNMDLDSITLYS